MPHPHVWWLLSRVARAPDFRLPLPVKVRSVTHYFDWLSFTFTFA